MIAIVVAAGAADGRNLFTLHAWHAVEAVGFLLVSLGGIGLSERARRRPKRITAAKPPRRHVAEPRGGLLACMAIAGAGAAAVHYVVMPDHFGESTLYGAFFLVAATTQLGYSLLLVLRPSRPLVAVGVIGDLAIVVLWLITRIVAIPLGPAAGSTETFGGLDVLASGFEAVVVLAGALALLGATRSGSRTARMMVRSPAAIAFAALAAVTVTVTAIAAPPS